MYTAIAQKQFAAMVLAISTTYGVSAEEVKHQFSVNPTITQTIYEKIRDSAEFLQMINMVPVEQIKGEKVNLEVNQLVTSRTDLTQANAERTPVDPSSLANKFYELFETEADVRINWNKIDTWSKFPDFFNRFMDHVNHARALDKITIGWHGIQADAQTDPATNTLGQDVNKGWLQILREFNGGSQVISEIVPASGKVTIGASGDFANLDALVSDMKYAIPQRLRNRGQLVVMLGEDLVAAQEGKYWAKQGETPTEKLLVTMAQVRATYGGLPAYVPTNFPEKGILITTFENLSIYYQDSSLRRSVKNKEEVKAIQDFYSVNEGYVVEDEEKAVYVESDSVEILTAA